MDTPDKKQKLSNLRDRLYERGNDIKPTERHELEGSHAEVARSWDSGAVPNAKKKPVIENFVRSKVENAVDGAASSKYTRRTTTRRK